MIGMYVEPLVIRISSIATSRLMNGVVLGGGRDQNGRATIASPSITNLAFCGTEIV